MDDAVFLSGLSSRLPLSPSPDISREAMSNDSSLSGALWDHERLRYPVFSFDHSQERVLHDSIFLPLLSSNDLEQLLFQFHTYENVMPLRQKNAPSVRDGQLQRVPVLRFSLPDARDHSWTLKQTTPCGSPVVTTVLADRQTPQSHSTVITRSPRNKSSNWLASTTPRCS